MVASNEFASPLVNFSSCGIAAIIQIEPDNVGVVHECIADAVRSETGTTGDCFLQSPPRRRVFVARILSSFGVNRDLFYPVPIRYSLEFEAQPRKTRAQVVGHVAPQPSFLALTESTRHPILILHRGLSAPVEVGHC